MKILMLLSNPFTHDPRVYNEALSLIKAGHKVKVLAWDPKRIATPREKKEGIEIIRSYNTRFMDILPYEIFQLHLWWNKGFKDSLKVYEEEPFDVVHAHDLDTLPIGVKLKKKLGVPLVYDAHEIWGYMVAKDLPWWKYYLWKEKNLINYADKIITVGEGYKRYLEGITTRPITLILNAKPLQSKTYIAPQNQVFTLLYIGKLNKTRFILETIEAVKDLENVKLIIGGFGKEDYVNAVIEKVSQASNVEFLGKVPMEQVIPMTQKADAVVCMFNPTDPLTKIGMPNKVFEAMVAGRPIIVTKGTYVGEFVESLKCGLVVEYNKKALREAIIKLRDDLELRERLGKNALNAALGEYSWEKQEEKLVRIYKELEEKN